jgi:acyl carrier protein
METILDILHELHDDVDFSTASELVQQGILNSLDIVVLVTEISDRLDVQIPAGEILPENFDSAQAIWAMVQRLDEA